MYFTTKKDVEFVMSKQCKWHQHGGKAPFCHSLLFLQSRSDEAEAEASKERKLRERSEEYTRSIEGELEKMQQRPHGRSPSLNSIEASQEVSR